MKIGIIGGGISGLTCALKLANRHQVSLFEANDYLGGHTATIDVSIEGQRHTIDTGFMLYNQRTYPRFSALLNELGLTGQPTQITVSITNPASGLEYGVHNLNALFAQRSNLLRPRFYQLANEIHRFKRVCQQRIDSGHHFQMTLADLLLKEGFSTFFAWHYLLPIGAAIWSSSLSNMRNFSLSRFLAYFDHHGLLEPSNQPEWMVVPGGSREYIRRLIALMDNRTAIHLATPVIRVTRDSHAVAVYTANKISYFDQVIFACHPYQVLPLLSGGTRDEREILGAIQYSPNELVLHTDTRILPHKRRARASWNYHLPDDEDGYHDKASVTYNMNMLQGIQSSSTLCLTLNPQQQIEKDKILHRCVYYRPSFNSQSAYAQQQRARINGHNRSWFCGAYWYNGFHEDGINSALDIVKQINRQRA